MVERYGGDYASIGDTIGVLLDFSKDGFASLSYYKNGRMVGMAWDKLPPQTYYPCVAIKTSGREVSVTLNSRAKLPAKSGR